MSQKISKRVPIEKLYERCGSTYKVVILAAKRALELAGGAPKLVEVAANEKPALIALREIAEGKVSFRIKKIKA